MKRKRKIEGMKKVQTGNSNATIGTSSKAYLAESVECFKSNLRVPKPAERWINGLDDST